MRADATAHRGIFRPQSVFASVLFLSGLFLGIFGFTAASPKDAENPKPRSDLPVVRTQRNGPSAPEGVVSGPGWSIITSPNDTMTGTGSLSSVACSAASDCWAVGYSSGSLTLTEHWDGTAWTIIPSPNNPGYNSFNGVT